MRINKDWKPEIVTCHQCKKYFEVKFEMEKNDNCRPVINSYNLTRIFYGHVDDDTWTEEEILQWINISQVLYICPHCRYMFGSNATCRVCEKPIYHWLGQATGITCSEEKCCKTSAEWLKKGGIPREALKLNNNARKTRRRK